jgi:membrane protein implicated in regulation of membrane protease activity/DNA-binding ferritin-like protein (Dps family)
MGVYEIVADCERYWRETNVPRATVREMAAELQAHLVDAQAEGKTPEAVVGPDLAEFAEAWASEYRRPMPQGSWDRKEQRSAWRRDMRSAYGWLGFAAAAIVVLAVFGPKENNVDDVELWRWIWVIGAAALGIGEMLTAGLFMLPFAIGAVAAAILAFANVAVPIQIAVFLAVSVLSLWGLKRFAWREQEPIHPVGAKRYVNARATVIETIDRIAGTGRVRLDTEQWRATTTLDVAIEPGTEVRVVDVTGARLVVEPLEPSG